MYCVASEARVGCRLLRPGGYAGGQEHTFPTQVRQIAGLQAPLMPEEGLEPPTRGL
jgi:hypothetical protein